MAREKAFSEHTQEILRSLPAVAEVTATRIYYTAAFRQEALARYEEGGSPVEIFREAGLDPKLIGYKRIERCFARWREHPRRAAASSGPASLAAPVEAASDSGEVRAELGEPASFDPRDRLIARQALRIEVLESEVRRLKRDLKTTLAQA